MYRINTDPKDYVFCTRCGQVANPTDGWEHGWPNYGHIQLGLDSCGQMQAPWIWENHPVMMPDGYNSPQQMTIEWGDGFQFDSTGRYRMCRECQRSLWQTLGDFFSLRTGEHVNNTTEKQAQ